MHKFELSIDLINAVLAYLDTKPHNEVRRMIDGIHQELNGQQVKGAEPVPEAEVVAE